MSRKIIAILGMPGSGKSEVINYLIEKYKWPKVYFGQVTMDEVERRGLEINEKNERIVREDLRKNFGKTYYAEKIVEKIKKLKDCEIVLVESLYGWPEYLVLKNEFGNELSTVSIYASPLQRYSRLEKRPFRPLNSEEAQSRDYAQIEKLDQGGPIAMADYTIINEGSRENLNAQVDQIINYINK